VRLAVPASIMRWNSGRRSSPMRRLDEGFDKLIAARSQ
jgi:hypothetical protein